MSDTPSGDFAALVAAARGRLAELADYILFHTGGYVVDGPFAGMRMPEIASWADGDLVPKLLGVYEAELHPPIEAAIARAPDLVVNVGCAEGYYAVGLARRLPEARIHAFDIAERAREVCAFAAQFNGVGRRVTVEGECTAGRLAELAAGAARPLALLDCEGAETALIAPDALPALARCDLIVECHDFVDPEITETLRGRLAPSHAVTIVAEAGRDPNRHPFVAGLNSFDRWLTMCEFRPERMHWLIATPRAANPED